jgi:hypothetical protein
MGEEAEGTGLQSIRCSGVVGSAASHAFPWAHSLNTLMMTGRWVLPPPPPPPPLHPLHPLPSPTHTRMLTDRHARSHIHTPAPVIRAQPKPR